MRRKLPARALARPSCARPLRPVLTASVLPTAAALAVLLAGCSTPTFETVAADPVTAKKTAPLPAPTPSASVTPYIEPEPGDVDGEMPYVKPTPVPSGKKP